MGKDGERKTLTILTNLKGSNVENLKNLDTFRKNVQIIKGNKEKSTMPLSRMMSQTMKVSRIKEINVMAFTTRFKESSNSELLSDNTFLDDNGNVNDGDLSDDALTEAYKTLSLRWTEESQVIENQKESIEAILQDKTYLMLTIFELKKEVRHLNYEIDGMKKFICMLNSEAENLIPF